MLCVLIIINLKEIKVIRQKCVRSGVANSKCSHLDVLKLSRSASFITRISGPFSRLRRNIFPCDTQQNMKSLPFENSLAR